MAEWQPIETAPTGVTILVWNAEDGVHVAVQRDRYNWSVPRVTGDHDETVWLYHGPTHWMPLPEAPE